jgi:uncharacterized membrane protein YeaQ/YmgE (transglycosylase-associated protein family)
MDYLFLKLIWWIVLAFAVGLMAGWMACGRDEKS